MTVVTTEQTPCSASSPTAGRPPSTRCRKHAFARFSPNVSPGTQVQGCSPSSRHVSYDLHRSLVMDCSVGRYYDPATGQFLSVDPLVEQTAHGYEYTGDNPVNAIDPLGMVTCGGWLSWIPGCGTATAVQHALSGVARAAWPNHFGSFLEGVDFSMEAIGAAGLGSLVFTASVAGEVPSFGLSTVGVLSSFGIFAGAGALAYVAYRSFSDAYAGAAVTRRSLSGPSSNIQKLSLLGARPC